MMEHVNFQLYRAHPNLVIWKKLKIVDKYINKRICVFIHQTMFVKGRIHCEIFFQSIS